MRHHPDGVRPVRVVVGEDDVLYREGLRRVLEFGGFEVVAVAATADDVVRKARAHRPDLVVTDVRMPPGNADDGLRAALEIRRDRPSTAILVLSQYIARHALRELLRRGADATGYLLKERVARVEEFLGTVERVGRGGSALDPQVVTQLMGGAAGDGRLDRLTPRERDVLGHMASGLTNRGIAAALVVTEDTVEKHVRNVLMKLDVPATSDAHRRVLAVLEYLHAADRYG